MSSQSQQRRLYTLNVTFKLGVNLNMAQVLVQNRVAQALPSCRKVQAVGVTTKKKSPSILLVVNLYSETDAATGKFNYDQKF